MLNLGDLKGLHASLKQLLISLLLMPFWYVAFYLFKDNLIDENSIITIVCFCFCLTLISALVVGLTLEIMNPDDELPNENTVSKKLYKKLKKQQKKDDIDRTTFSTIVQITWLSILIILTYSSKYLCGSYLKFYSFVSVYYIVCIVVLIVISCKKNIALKKAKNI